MNPSIEEMLTIEPPPAPFIGSITAFMPSQQPTAFTSRTRRKPASGMSSILANSRMPALFTSTSSRPGLHRQRGRRGPVVLAGDVVVQIAAGLLAEPGRHVPALVVKDVTEDHPGALGDEVPHMGLAHPPGAPGDQRDLAVEPAHDPSGPLRSRTTKRLLARA